MKNLMIFLLGASSLSHSQTIEPQPVEHFYDCEYIVNPDAASFTLDPECQFNSLKYFPDEFTSHKVIKVNIHYMQQEGPNPLNWTATDDGNGDTSFTGFDHANMVIDFCNAQLASNDEPMNLPQGNTTPLLNRTYSYTLKGVFFHADNAKFTFGGTSGSGLLSQFGVNVGSEVNIFFVYDETAPPISGGGDSFAFDGWVRQRAAWQNHVTFASGYWGSAQNLNHEIGHFLSLHHTVRFPTGPCGDFNDFCSDTPLRSVLTGAGEPDPCCGYFLGVVPPACSNNLMDYSSHLVITPEQLGRVHRSLLNEVIQFIEEDYCEVDPALTTIIPSGTDYVLDNSEIFYGDVIIEPNASLKIECEIFMPNDGRIIVMEGAKLTLNGGKITNRCGGLWAGIEVHGNTALSQFFGNQGEVSIVNGSLIEHADVAIALWEPGNWSSTGGFVKSSNSTFLNNRKDVEFITPIRKFFNKPQKHTSIPMKRL